MTGSEMRAFWRAHDRKLAREAIDWIRQMRIDCPGECDETWWRETLRSLRASHSLSIRAEKMGVFA